MNDRAIDNPTDRLAASDERGRALFAGIDEAPGEQAGRDFATLLPDWTVLRIAGADAARFLQGQLTCDVGRLAILGAVAGAHCTPKGRVVANFLLTRTAEDTFEIVVPAGAAEALRASLGKYIVFSKATIEPTDLALIGCHGNAAAAAAIGAEMPAPGTVALDGTARATRLDSADTRLLLWLPGAELAARWQALTTRARPADGAAWELLNIRDGLAYITEETVEAFIPQMINLPQVGAVSFNKGCYTGQEVVARAHYRGAVKRHMQHLVAPATATCPAPGDTVYRSGKSAGTVVTAISTGDRVEALVVVSVDAAVDDLALDESGRFPLQAP